MSTKVGERLLIDAGERVAQRVQRPGVERRQAIEFAERLLAQRQGVLVEKG